MCMPAAALPFIEMGVSAASSLAAAGAQSADAAATARSANAGAQGEYDQLTMKAIQDEAATGQKVSTYNLEGAIRAASAQATEAAAGVGGNSVDTIVNSIQGAAANNAYNAKVNGDFEAEQVAYQKQGVYAETQSRINSAPRPNPVATALGIAGSALKITPDQWSNAGASLGLGAASA